MTTLGTATYCVVTLEYSPNPADAVTLQGVESIRLLLVDQDTGHSAEVQVARVNGGLVIIAAGSVLADRDARGFARLRVDPE